MYIWKPSRQINNFYLSNLLLDSQLYIAVYPQYICLAIYSGDPYLYIDQWCKQYQILKFRGCSLLPRQLLYVYTDHADVDMGGRYTCYFTTTRKCNLRDLFLRVSSSSAHCASSPVQTGVATQGCQLTLKGVSWTCSSVVDGATLKTYFIYPCMLGVYSVFG